MESVDVTCGNCEHAFRSPAEKIGRLVRCPECGETIRIPESDGVAQVEVSTDDAPSAGGATEVPLTPPENALPPVAIGAAVAAGIIGAAIWAATAKFANYEIGYVAWGIGALVGGAAMFMGAAGRFGGMVCAVVALLSIAGGKYLGTAWVLSDLGGEATQREIYDEYVMDARMWNGLDRDDREQVGRFMVTREYADSMPSDEEIDDFLAFDGPVLVSMHEDQPSFEE